MVVAVLVEVLVVVVLVEVLVVVVVVVVVVVLMHLKRCSVVSNLKLLPEV